MIFAIRPKVLAALGVFGLSACAEGPRKQTSSTRAEGDNRSGRDITILQAWVGDTLAIASSPSAYPGANYRLKPSECEEVKRHTHNSSRGGSYDSVIYDCARAIERAGKLPNFSDVSPILAAAIHTVEETNNSTYSRTGQCELVEFRTLMANEVAGQPTLDGIGFFVGGAYEGREYYVEHSRLHKVGDVTLTDGRPGSVHRFFIQGFCWGMGGTGDSAFHRQYRFRPFVRFVANGQKYNTWDDVPKNYFLGRAVNNHDWIGGFDRQNELLKTR